MSGRATVRFSVRTRSVSAAIGRAVRVRAAFLLMIAALALGVLCEACRPTSWRRTVRAEFRRTLRRAAGEGLATTLVAGFLIGLAMVSQALYWLGLAGQQSLIGTILVTVLVREVIPVLIGLILLGRSGMVTVTELGTMQLGGQVRSMAGSGIDPFLVLVLPRALGFALASFTLGVLFACFALVVGFVAGSLLGAVEVSLWTFLDDVLTAMRTEDFVVFPAKMLVIGLLVGLTACLTGLTAEPGDSIATLLPRGFVRGLVVVMSTSLILSLTV